MNPDLPYIIGFSKVLEIGPVKFSQIISLFGTAEEAWEAPLREFTPLNFSEKILASIKKTRDEVDPEKEFSRCEKLGVKVVTTTDDSYPRLLKEIYDPPFILYIRGDLKEEDEVALAIVGSRRMTTYGYYDIESLMPPLCF